MLALPPALSLSLPFSFPFAHPVNLSNNLLRLLRVPLFHRRPGRRRRFAAVTMPTHHMMIYSCPPGLSCRLRSVGRSVACFFSLHISSIYVRIYFLTKNLISPHCLLFSWVSRLGSSMRRSTATHNWWRNKCLNGNSNTLTQTHTWQRIYIHHIWINISLKCCDMFPCSALALLTHSYTKFLWMWRERLTCINC